MSVQGDCFSQTQLCRKEKIELACLGGGTLLGLDRGRQPGSLDNVGSKPLTH